MTTRTFAYCRVSSVEQNTNNQLQEIMNAGFVIPPQRVITETVSGSLPAKERKGFSKLLIKLDEGDILVVTKLDRLGRNAMDVRSTIEELASVGVRVHCLALGGVDLTSSAGKMTMSVIAAVAEFERDLLVERTQSGLARAKAEGKALGRPSSLAKELQAKALSLLSEGKSVASVAREISTSRQTIMRLRHSDDRQKACNT